MAAAGATATAPAAVRRLFDARTGARTGAGAAAGAALLSSKSEPELIFEETEYDRQRREYFYKT